MIVIRVHMMKRSDRQVYRLIKEAGKSLTIGEIVEKTEYTPRNVLRILSRLRQQKMVLGIRDGRHTYYECTDT